MHTDITPTSILLVGITKDDRKSFQIMLDEGRAISSNLSQSLDLRSAVEMLSQDKTYTAIVVDSSTHDLTDEKIAKALALRSVHIPLLLLSDDDGQNLAKKVILLGGQDYLIRGKFDGAAIRASIEYAKEHIRDYGRSQQVKDDFLAIVAHQLRTPATIVKQYVGMVLEGYYGPVTLEQSEALNIAKHSNERQFQIIQDILQTSRMYSEHIILSKDTCEMVGLLEQIITEQDAQLDLRKQTITFEHPDKPITLHADSHYLRLAIENIIGNASKYTAHGKRIQVTLEKKIDRILVTIRDEGVGIASKDIKIIFNKFTRASNSLSRTVGGSGLGLYLSKQIVNLHDGEIIVNSELNKGTAFTIELPLHSPQLA